LYTVVLFSVRYFQRLGVMFWQSNTSSPGFLVFQAVDDIYFQVVQHVRQLLKGLLMICSRYFYAVVQLRPTLPFME
jgi:hypothetical protein